MKFRNIPVTLDTYIHILMMSLRKHSFGKLITDWSSLPWGQRIYMLLMFGMYTYNIYQNVVSCYQFYRNSAIINTDICNMRKYLAYSKDQLGTFINLIQDLPTYKKYRSYLQSKLEDIDEIHTSLNKVPLASFSPRKVPYIGYTMKQYYLLYESEKIDRTLLFSFGFHGYLEKLSGIANHVSSGKLNKATLSSKEKPILKFTQSYYPVMLSTDNVPNDINLTRNHIVTGPNASGKTTLLKNTIVNLLISQQIGFGFYKKARLTPFDYIHCYLNIPDTSSRDSLFQAEARRCLDILDCINTNNDKKHFCIFDELFSGTNPYEAISSAQAYLTHICTFKGVKFLLTTHFIELCNMLEDNHGITNVNMKTDINDDVPKYYYKVKKGISSIKGGITVLKQLVYPDKIIQDTRKTVNAM